jgi:hypothetical protein
VIRTLIAGTGTGDKQRSARRSRADKNLGWTV